MKKRLITSLAVGFAVAFYFALVLPVQTYLGNADCFNYTLTALLKELSVYFGALFASVSLALLIVSFVTWKRPFFFLHLALLALTLAFMLETGPLSIGLPELNGDFSGYKSMSRAIWDYSALLAVILIPLACYRWLRGSLTWIALAIAFYSAATLFDVKVKSQRPEGMEDFIVPRLVPRTEVVRSAEFSPKRNVIMLILDSISVDACVDAFAADPDLAAHFTGFVNYTNNVGMAWPTHMAMPGIFTGKYCESLDELAKYGQSMWMKDSFLKPYLDRNIPVYVNVALTRDGYTNRLKPQGDNSMVAAHRPTEEQMLGMYPMTLPELMGFRSVPYFAKESYVSGLAFPTNSASVGVLDPNRLFHDDYLWKELATKPVNPAHDMTLHVHHVMGGHPPTKFTRDGKPAKPGDTSYAGHVEQCVYVFRQVAKLFDVWRTNGVYDASSIIVIADHSNMYQRPGCSHFGIPGPAFPFLMVKSQFSNSTHSCVGEPTSHQALCRLLQSLVVKDLKANEITAELQTEKRRCFSLSETERKDWIVAANHEVSNIKTAYTNKTDTVAFETLELDRNYSFRVSDGLFMGYGLKGGRRADWDGTSGTNMVFTFKMPEKNQQYDFDIKLSNRLLDIQSIRVSAGNISEIVNTKAMLRGIVSDDDAKVQLAFEKLYGEGRFSVQGIVASKHRKVSRKDGACLSIGDVDIPLNKKAVNYNYKDLAGRLEPGSSYRLTIDRVEILSGQPKFQSVVLYDFMQNGSVASKRFNIDISNRFNLWDWEFTVPSKDGKYHCIVYAGDVGKTAGNGLKLKGVKFIQLENDR